MGHSMNPTYKNYASERSRLDISAEFNHLERKGKPPAEAEALRTQNSSSVSHDLACVVLYNCTLLAQPKWSPRLFTAQFNSLLFVSSYAKNIIRFYWFHLNFSATSYVYFICKFHRIQLQTTANVRHFIQSIIHTNKDSLIVRLLDCAENLLYE